MENAVLVHCINNALKAVKEYKELNKYGLLRLEYLKNHKKTFQHETFFHSYNKNGLFF